jgi:hypothetical protein
MLCAACFTGVGQTTPAVSSQQVEGIVLEQDSLFWITFNTCDVDEMQKFFTEDLEFYHDRNGLTTTLDKFMSSTRTGLCGTPSWRLRREVVEGSLKVYPLDNYGAILYGEHVFYIIENNQPPRLDGLAKFTHVWKYADGKWKMHRILSYDHGPAPASMAKKLK